MSKSFNPNMSRVVYLKYVIKDLESMYTYTGLIELGTVKPQILLDNDVIINHITQWMGPGSLQHGPLHQYVQFWNIPPAQDLVDMKFDTSTTCTDIPANLRIPPGQLSPMKCIISNQEVEIHSRPINTTVLD